LRVDLGNADRTHAKVVASSLNTLQQIALDHKDAYALGARYYRVLVNGAPGLDVWTDLKLNTTTHEFETQTMTPATIGGKSGYYQVRNPADVWLTANLGDLLSTLALSYEQPNIAARR
jgi:hypothetical protein